MDGLKTPLELDASALLADRARLDLALAAAGNAGVWDGDLVSGRIYADANFARIYGVDPAAALAGQPLGHYFGCLHPDDQVSARAAMQGLLEGTVCEFSHEHRICRPDGTMRWVLARGRIIRNAASQNARLPGLSFDITDRRQAEIRQAFLVDLLDRMRMLSDPVAILDVTVSLLGRHLAVARAGYSELAADQRSLKIVGGYADGVPPLNETMDIEKLGQGNVARIRQGCTVVHSDVQADPENATDTFRRLGSRGLLAIPLIRDGQLRATLWAATITPRAWHDAEIALMEDVAARLWDALERARAERALRDANALLEQRVAAALEARERVEDALRQSQKMEAIGQLTGGIAHDFNNMLQGISSAVELMNRRIVSGRPAEAARYVAAAQAGIARAAALTHRLLAFSRRQALAPARVDVAELVEGLAAMIRQTTGPSIAVNLTLAAVCWPVECDPNQLENALLNLVINARDAILPGGGMLAIETAPESFGPESFGPESFAPDAALPGLRPGDYVRLTIRDSGSGMTPDILSHAFEPFFTTKPTGQGTGLGLSQVYGFVSQSKGAVRIESAPGEGTSVHLYLPRHQKAVADEASRRKQVGALGCASGAKVLLVEDEPQIRSFLAEALFDLGFKVFVAETGSLGLEALRANPDIYLLIADVGLPGGLNGRQLADAGRTLLPHLPVLLITGYAGDAIADGALPADTWVLPKPFTLAAMVDRLITIFANSPPLRP